MQLEGSLEGDSRVGSHYVKLHEAPSLGISDCTAGNALLCVSCNLKEAGHGYSLDTPVECEAGLALARIRRIRYGIQSMADVYFIRLLHLVHRPISVGETFYQP